MALYAIGDVQGCMDSLERLLVAIDYQRGRDRLWLVGDLVNRGPRSLDTLRWARDQGDSVVAVLGNHDLHLLARAAGTAEAKRRDSIDDVLAAPDRDELVDWLRARPLLHVEDDLVLVHAGLHPRWTVARALALAGELEAGLRGTAWKQWLTQLGGAPPPWSESLEGAARVRALLSFFVRVRCCDVDDAEPVTDFDGPPEDAPEGAVPWYALPDPAWADHTVIFGHWAAHGLRMGERWIATDAGCVWGKGLTAVRLPDRAVTQVKSVETAS
ncbi:MAG TPA: symmetrical bis(5'-nucleosyl)-tetraphosphatase [Kofleriaceae bacterium]|nr:symmetrical bis(5'-nucleosyl)-tetraphosphatase [Kofleriaceae bacterium]